jgi:hypothetical protein
VQQTPPVANTAPPAAVVAPAQDDQLAIVFEVDNGTDDGPA